MFRPSCSISIDSQESRELISRFTSSNRFNIDQSGHHATGNQQNHRCQRGCRRAGHSCGLRQLLRKGQNAPLQVLVDGTNSNTAMIALGYVNTIAEEFAQDYVTDLMQRSQGIRGMRKVQVTLEQRPWFNPDLNGRWFFVPGIIGPLP